jgi:hypothetical protein
VDRTTLLAHVRDSLAQIRAPRFFETERGYQGALLAQLEKRIPHALLPEGAVFEQEHQKRLAHHGLSIRPDIIIHEPFDPARHKNRTEGNIAVIELKLNATLAQAAGDFKNLCAMVSVLRYPIAIFINIGSALTLAHVAPPEAKGRIACFGVSLRNGSVDVVEEQV